ADKPHYDRLSKVFKDITGMTGAPSSLDRDDRGAFWSWAYAQGGMWSFSTPGWTRPDLVKRADEMKADDDTPDAPDAQPDERPQRGGPPAGRGPRGPGARPVASGGSSSSAGDSADDAKWLAYAKERGEGFIDWTPFNHPQLGEVEIGGFVPGFRMNPPTDDMTRLLDEQTRFVRTLLHNLPRVEIDAPAVAKV